MQFSFAMPTTVYFGENAVAANASALLLGKHALVVSGKTSGRKSGAIQDVFAALEGLGVRYESAECIGNNPDVEQCKAIGDDARAKGVDFVIGVGGGSPLDAAKAIAVFAANDISVERSFEYGYDNGVLPIVAVPTTAGTGSEVTPWAIMTWHKIQAKKTIGGPLTFPKVAFLDLKYTRSLTPEITMSTAIDAFTHCFESVISPKASALTDAVNLEALRHFGGCMQALEAGAFDALREELLLVSMMSGIGIANTGTTLMHAMAYPLTYFKGVPHGAANAMVLPSYLQELQTHRSDRLGVALDALGCSAEELSAYARRNFAISFSVTDEELMLWAQQTSERNPMQTTGVPGDVTHIFEVYKRLF